MALQRSYGWYCGTDPAEIAAAVAVVGANAVAAGPAIFQASRTSTDPGAAFAYTAANGASETMPAFDATESISSLRQIRAAGKSAILKMLFYSQDGTPCTDIDPGSEAAAVAWCESYYTTVLEPFFASGLPLGAEFDVLNLETELNQVTGSYPAAWRELVGAVRAAGFTGIVTSSANDPTPATTPWAASLDWFGYDSYPALTNSAYRARYPDAGDVSNPRALRRFFAAALPLEQISAQFGGVPVYLGEFGFGFGPDGGLSSPVPWSDAELTTMTEAFFDVLGPSPCWAGMNLFDWPYDNPDGTATSPRAALLDGLSAGWTAYPTAPAVPALSQIGPGARRGRGPLARTVIAPTGAGPMARRVSRRSVVKGFGGATAAASVAGSVAAWELSRPAAGPGVLAGAGVPPPGRASPGAASQGRATRLTRSAGRAQRLEWSEATPWADLTLDTPCCALALPAPPAGGAAEMQLILRQDELGHRKVAWPSNVRSIGAIPALTTSRHAFDQFTLYSEDGATWTLEGTPGGPSGSIDPLALADPVLVVEARAQPLQAGDTIASAGGTATSLLDRSPAGRPLAATTSVPATFEAQAGPGSPWYGPLQPGETGHPRVDLPAGGVLALDGLRATDDYLLYYLVWQHPRTSSQAGFNYLTLDNGPGTTIWGSGNADNFWHDVTSYHNYSSSPGNTPDYATIPLLGVIAVGAESPGGRHAAYHRLNGAVQAFDVPPSAPIGLKGMAIGTAGGAAAASIELDVITAGIVSPCPPLADIRRLEQWVAGLGGISVVSA